jgi:hypothetical protein
MVPDYSKTVPPHTKAIQQVKAPNPVETRSNIRE